MIGNKQNIYKELFDFVRRTGERLVVINPDKDEAIVVLPLSDYQGLKSVITFGKSVRDSSFKEPKRKNDFSFWDQTNKETIRLDKGTDSGRIDTVRHQKSIPTSKNFHGSKQKMTEQDAGDGYYFEPIDQENV